MMDANFIDLVDNGLRILSRLETAQFYDTGREYQPAITHQRVLMGKSLCLILASGYEPDSNTHGALAAQMQVMRAKTGRSAGQGLLLACAWAGILCMQHSDGIRYIACPWWMNHKGKSYEQATIYRIGSGRLADAKQNELIFHCTAKSCHSLTITDLQVCLTESLGAEVYDRCQHKIPYTVLPKNKPQIRYKIRDLNTGLFASGHSWHVRWSNRGRTWGRRPNEFIKACTKENAKTDRWQIVEYEMVER